MVGSLITSLLGLRWTFHLFAGAGTDQELKALGDSSPATPGAFKDPLAQIHRVREEFAAGHFKYSGLAGPFREAQQQETREHFLVAVESLYDLLYLLGEVLLHFHRISDSLGDYGMIRVSLWLHPCLDSVIEKVQRLQTSLKGLSKAVDSELVIAKARGRTVKKPLPSDRMSSRAHAAVERALVGHDCHLSALLHTLEELKTRSSPERLPHVVEGLGDACVQLQNVLTSPQFRARVGDSFPQRLPSLANMTRERPTLQLTDEHAEPLGACSDEELDELEPHQEIARDNGADRADRTDDADRHDHSVCFFLFGEARRKTLSSAMWSTFRSLRGPGWHTSLSSPYAPAPVPAISARASNGAPSSAPSDLVSELPPDGWISHTNRGRTSWHHTSLGPAPWQQSHADELFAKRYEEDSGTSPVRDTVRDTNPFSDDLSEPQPQPQPPRLPPRLPPDPQGEVTGFGMTPAASPGEHLEQSEVKMDSPGFGMFDSPDARRPRASTMPGLKGCLRAEVQRLTSGVQGWKAHDSRSLLITGSQLLIYQKGSKEQVKTVVDICDDVERCLLLPEGVLSLEVRRKRRSSSLSRFTPRKDEERSFEKKLYFFKFEPQELAQHFNDIISSQSRG